MSVDAVASTGFQVRTLKAHGAGTGHAPATRPRPERPPLDLPTRESLTRDTASFAADIAKVFGEAGIRVPPEPVLGNDAQGHVRVANDHPDKDRIERLFEDNPELQQRYAKLSAGSSLLRAAENHNQFAAEYERLEGNLAAQSALVEATVARNKAPFYMTITAKGAETFFSESIGV